MNTRRILFIIDTLDAGGAERRLTRLIGYVRAHAPEFEPRVLTLLPSRFPAPLRHRLQPQIEAAGATVESLDLPAWDPRLWLRARAVVARFRPRLIQSFLWTADNVAAWAGRHVPRIGSECGNRPLWEARPAWARAFARAVDRRLSFRGAARFIANTHSGARLLERWGLPPQKIEVIHTPAPDPAETASSSSSPPPPCDPLAQAGLPHQVRLVGMAARLTAVKRVDLLLAAVSALRAEGRAVAAIILGEGEERERLERLARAHGLIASGDAAGACFAGYVERPSDWLKRMDAVVCCGDSEMFSNAALEAMACGRPVVATRVGGMPEMIEDGRTGLLIDKGDAAALADALRRLLDNPDFARSLGQAARVEAATRFSVDRAFGAYLKLYRELTQ